MTEAILKPLSHKDLRSELEELILRDLHGPQGGEDEELNEHSVRDRYILGVLAPREQFVEPEELDELSSGDEESREDGIADLSAPSTKTLFPSSMGLSFCVDGEASAISVTVCWGRYERVESEIIRISSGAGKRVWKRTPVNITAPPISLKEGTFGPVTVTDEQPGIKLQGLIRSHLGDWIVSLFLVNGQAEPKQSKDKAWLFQTGITVKSPGEKPIFIVRPIHRESGCPIEDEERLLEMNYRNKVEFAVGHGVAVHVDVDPHNHCRALSVATCAVPSYEVPRVAQPPSSLFENLQLDMKILSESGTPEKLLSPLADCYASWIKDQRQRISVPEAHLAEHKGVAEIALSKCEESLSRMKEGLELLGSDKNAVDAFRFMNRVMALQRVHTLFSEMVRRSENPDIGSIDIPENRSWFPLTLSVLSVPEAGDTLEDTVRKYWSTHFHDVDNPGVIKHVLKNNELRAISHYPNEKIWNVIEKIRNQDAGDESSVQPLDIKGPEWERLSKPDPSYNNADFELSEIKPPQKYSHYFSKIVLAHRLREARALIGFTRIEAPGELSEAEEFDYKNAVSLSRGKPLWVPSGEVRGEGIFIQFNQNTIDEWSRLTEVRKRDREFLQSHMKWRISRKIEKPGEDYPSICYILLHTLAHALMRQLAVECGYTFASIRERIYSLPSPDPRGPMAGILIYTSATDSEGTLGGLVSLGKPDRLERLMDQALDAARLCASDPLCAEHAPSQDGQTIHGAACHACLFAPEPSCERGNKYLDRSVLVETLQNREMAFFRTQSQ